MKYTKAKVKEAILQLEAEACASMSADLLFIELDLAHVTWSMVRNAGVSGWRESCIESAALLREGWLPGDDIVDLKTGEVLA